MTLQELLDQAGVDYRRQGEHHHATRGRISVDCPHCSPGSKRFRLGLHPGKRTASCWTCGRLPFFSVLKELFGEVPFSFRGGNASDPFSFNSRHGKSHKQVFRPPVGLGPLLKPHVAYLKSRRFDSEELSALWGVQGIGSLGKPPWKIFIPIKKKQEIVSFTRRSLVNTGIRYLAAKPEEEKISGKDLLFGEDFCAHACIVCEGAMDAMRIGPGAVALMGLNYTRKQVLKISKYPLRVIVLDSEPQAQDVARRLCSELSVFPGETLRVELSGKDPDSSPESELKELRKYLK